MDEKTAQLVLCAIAATEVVVWLAALQFLLLSFGVRKSGAREAAERLQLTDPPPENLLVGSAEVEGQPAELAAKAAALLAKEIAGPLGQLKILSRTADRVVFEGTGANPAGRSAGRHIRQGQLQFTRVSDNRTAVDYAIAVSGGRGLLWGGVVCQVLGLLALSVGFWLLQTYVVHNPNPGARWQTIQMVQAIHFLWPPFLFGGLYRMGPRAIRSALDVLIHNLPY
jgi:hypothetical protein